MQVSSLVLAACLHSCCECNGDKGNLKSLTSKNIAYFYTDHCGQRGSGHLQTIARILSSDPQVPSPGAWLSISAQSSDKSMLAAQHKQTNHNIESHILSMNLNYNILTSRYSHLPMASGKIFQLLGISAEILGHLMELRSRRIQLIYKGQEVRH